MLTGSFLQRFLFKWKYTVLIFLIVTSMAAFLTYQINHWLPHFVRSFSDIIAQQFNAKIAYDTAHYRFPNYIILKNILVLGVDGKSPMLQASRMTLGFSFPFLNSAQALHYVNIQSMSIHARTLREYWRRYHERVYALSKKIPRGDLRVGVSEVQVYPDTMGQMTPVSFNMAADAHQGQIRAAGSGDFHGQFDFELKGRFQDRGFDLEKLNVQTERMSFNLWGSWRNHRLDWKGYIFYDRWYILDIDGRVKVHPQDIVLDQLTFSVDDDAAAARAHCTREAFFQCDADITYLRQTQNTGPPLPLKNIRLRLHLANTPQGLIYSGVSDLDKAHLEFANLKTLIFSPSFMKFHIGKVQGTFPFQNRTYAVPLDDVLASLNFAKPYHKTISLSAGLMAGHGFGRVFLDTSSLPWKIQSQGHYEGLKIPQGILSGTFHVQTVQNLALEGVLTLHRGHFENTPIASWMAKLLQMPSLARQKGAEFSCRYRINGQSKLLEDLKLRTEDLDLSGYFHINADDLVAAQGSVRFSKNLLNESTIGRKIIVLAHGAWSLPFEFSLSGYLYRMNFQWNKSPLKDRVRRHMFSLYERMIDRRIDAKPSYNVTMPSESVSPG